MHDRWFALLLATVLGAASLHGADRSIDPIVSHIRRNAVESTALSAVGYSRRLHALEIEFHDGLIYRYLEVPRSVYRELISAESKAQFYNRKIRGKYRCLRVKNKRTP